jgi:PTS system nitrogen regulatory IIA component
MPQDWYSLEELAEHLGRDRREIERLANRGRIPCHRRSGEWQFHAAEVTQWLEQEMRQYSDSQLAAVELSQRSDEVDAQVPVSSLMTPELVQVPFEARTRRSVLEGLIEVAGRTWKIWQPAAVLKAVQEREELMSTAFENGVALPHTRQPLPDAVAESVVAFGRTLSGIPFGAPNNSLTDLFFLVVCRDSRTHLHVLARLGRLIQRPEFLASLREAPDSAAAYDVIAAGDQGIG